MAKPKIPKQPAPVITIERAEFQHLTRTLVAIEHKAANAQRILEAIDSRASNEFQESLRIIGGAQPENEGAGR